MPTYALYPYAIQTEQVKVAADPTATLEVATKQYVDGKVATGGPPTGSASGDLSGVYPGPSIAAGAVTYAKLAADAQLWRDTGSTLTPGTTVAARPVVIPAGQLVVGAAGAPVFQLGQRFYLEAYDGGFNSLWTNNAASPSYDVTKAGWALRFNYATNYTQLLYRAPNTTTDVEKFQVNANGDINVTGAILSNSAGGGGGLFRGTSANGSLAAPTAISQYATLAKLSGLGCYAAGAYAEGADLFFYANENWTTTAHGTAAKIELTSNGTTTLKSINFFGDGTLAIDGPVGQKSTGTTWANPSDIRLKKNVTPYTAGLKEVLALQPVQFEHNGFADTDDGLTCWGYLADDVAAVMPECVSKQQKRLRNKTVVELDVLDTSNISLAVVNAIKELAARVAALEAT